MFGCQPCWPGAGSCLAYPRLALGDLVRFVSPSFTSLSLDHFVWAGLARVDSLMSNLG